MTHRIYCSGPLFCAEEIGGMTAIAKVLENEGYQTFLPHRDGLESYVFRFADSSFPSSIAAVRSRIDYAIFSLDVYELLERGDAAVCNLNGRVPDEGMIVEAALAYSAGKPLVFFKNDIRSPFSGYDNSMLTSLVRGRIIKKITDLPSALKEAISQKRDSKPSVNDDLKKAILYGKRISSVLENMPEKMFKKTWPEAIINKVIGESFIDG